MNSDLTLSDIWDFGPTEPSLVLNTTELFFSYSEIKQTQNGVDNSSIRKEQCSDLSSHTVSYLKTSSRSLWWEGRPKNFGGFVIKYIRPLEQVVKTLS